MITEAFKPQPTTLAERIPLVDLRVVGLAELASGNETPYSRPNTLRNVGVAAVATTLAILVPGVALGENPPATVSKKDPTAHLQSVHSPKILQWESEITARCPEDLAVSAGHNKKRRDGNSLTLSIVKDHTRYDLKLKKDMSVCASIGVTENEKVRKNVLKFLKRKHGYKYYRYSDNTLTNSGYATSEVDVAIKSKR
jgi:hypothetical protein